MTLTLISSIWTLPQRPVWNYMTQASLTAGSGPDPAPQGPATKGTTSMPLQPTGWAPRAEQNVLPHPTDLLLVAHGRGRRRYGSELCPCARNQVKLPKHTNHLKRFPEEEPLQAISMDMLGPLPLTERGKRFLLVITDRFSKLTAVVPLRTTNAYSVAIAFCEEWIFKYGPPSQF